MPLVSKIALSSWSFKYLEGKNQPFIVKLFLRKAEKSERGHWWTFEQNQKSTKKKKNPKLISLYILEFQIGNVTTPYDATLLCGRLRCNFSEFKAEDIHLYSNNMPSLNIPLVSQDSNGIHDILAYMFVTKILRLLSVTTIKERTTENWSYYWNGQKELSGIKCICIWLFTLENAEQYSIYKHSIDSFFSMNVLFVSYQVMLV